MLPVFSFLLLACLAVFPATADPAKEERKVVKVRDGQILNGIVPEIGKLYILPPRGYQVTQSKMEGGLTLTFDAPAAGIILEAVHPANSPKGALTLLLADGRRVSLTVRTQKVGYLNNYLLLQ